jgi:fibronectin-binding autotransporter adhesin
MRQKKGSRRASGKWIAAAACTPFLLCGADTRASSLTWDANGASPHSPVDGSGTWNTTSADWSNLTTDQAWMNSSSTVATFGDAAGTAGTVNLSVPIQAGGLVFNPTGKGNYNLSGSTLNLSGGMIALNGSNPTISSSLISSNSLTVSGTGSLTLLGNNNFNGTTVNGGNLIAASSGALGTGIADVNSQGTLTVNASINLDGGENYGTFTVSAGQTIGLASGTNVFNQCGGTLNVDGLLNCTYFIVLGGTINGTVNLVGSDPDLVFDVTSDFGGTFVISTNGSSGSLAASTIPGGTSVLFQPMKTATLSGYGNIQNNGTLSLTSAPNCTDNLSSNLTNYGSFNTASTGTSSGAANLSGALLNVGTINVGSGSSLNVLSTTNDFQQSGGSVNIASNSSISVIGAFVCNGGTITLAPADYTPGNLRIASLTWPKPSGTVNPLTDIASINTSAYTGQQKPGELTVSGYSPTFNIADGSATLIISAAIIADQINQIGPGTIELNGLQQLFQMNVDAGTLMLGSNLNASGTMYIAVANGATLKVLGSQGLVNVIDMGAVSVPASSTSGIHLVSLQSLNLESSQTVSVAAATVHANRTLLQISELDFSSGTNGLQGLVDLTSNDADILEGNISNITNLIKVAFNGGNWNGAGGITSSTAAHDTTHLTALGCILNDQNGTSVFTASHPFDGFTPGTVEVLVKYTYYGDANLSGSVDGSDYSLIDNAYLADQSTPGRYTGWYNGDFNYDGVINGSDYTLIDNAFNSQGTAITSSIAAPLANVTTEISTGEISTGEISAVPEPTGLAALGLLCLSARRRFRSRRVSKNQS